MTPPYALAPPRAALSAARSTVRFLVPVLASSEAVAGITASATLIAAAGFAWVTIHTTNKRLDGEQVRQGRALDAEAERHAATLLSDRELADIHDLRGLLDETAAALEALAAAIRQARIAIDATIDSGYTPGAAAVDLKAAREPLEALRARIGVRLGPDDPIARAVARAGFIETAMQMRMRHWPEHTARRDPALFVGEVEVELRAFYAAAVERAGSSSLAA
jgi:hypothetical protein